MCTNVYSPVYIRVKRAQRKRDFEATRRLAGSVDGLQATSGWVPVERVTVSWTFLKKVLIGFGMYVDFRTFRQAPDLSRYLGTV